MAILDRDSLEQSPLADLHAIASELSIDGYRRLRKAGLIDAILESQGAEEGGEQPSETDEPEPARAPSRRRGRRRRSSEPKARAEGAQEGEEDADTGAEAEADQPERPRDQPERPGGNDMASFMNCGTIAISIYCSHANSSAPAEVNFT